jgi:hypothetical protein
MDVGCPGIESNCLQNMSTKEPRSRREIQIALAFTVMLVAGVLLFCAAFDHPQDFDFAGCYSAGLISREAGTAKVYDVQRQMQVQRSVLGRTQLFLYAYPPVHALMFAQLARFPYVTAYIIWGCLDIVLWALFVCLMRPYAAIPRDPLRYLMLCFLFLPAWAALVLGQSSLILLVLYTLTYICLRHRHDYWAGVFLGLGLLKYHLVLPFALILLLRGKWRVIAGFGLACSVLVALSFWTAGSAGVLAYGRLMLDIVRDPANPAYESFSPRHIMPTIWGFFTALLGRYVSLVWIKILAAMTCVGLVFFTALRWRREELHRGEESLAPMFASALSVSLLVTPHLYTYDLTLMLLVMLLMFNSFRWTADASWRRSLTIAAVLLYLPLYPLLFAHGASFLLVPVLLFFALSGGGTAVTKPA